MASFGSGRQRKEQPREVQISKFMSWVLRHGAQEAGVKMDGDGWVCVDELLKTRKMRGWQVKEPELKELVASNGKQRFALKEEGGKLFIRANQGHSIKSVKSDNLLKKLTLADLPDYPVVVHGTTRQNYQKIQESKALSKMSRNHIHFAKGLPKDKQVISGMRNTSNVFVYLDLKKCLEEGVDVFVSDNGVILLPGDEKGFLSEKYFEKVTFV